MSYARFFTAGGHDVHINAAGQWVNLTIRNQAGELVHKNKYLLGDYSAAKIKQDARDVIAAINVINHKRT